MIDQLTICGFKRFDTAQLSIEPLTVLTGLNGAGKTSVIQALLLMREANRSQHVKLRGPFDLELGTAADVLNWQHATDIEFHVREDGVAFDWVLQSPSDEARHLLVISKPDPLPMAFQAATGRFTYLSAERLGPRVRVDASSLPVDELEIGVRGEFAAEIIEVRGLRPGFDDRHHPNLDGQSLLKYQIEMWLGEIARPLQINAEHHKGADAYALSFQAPEGEWVRAPNMGFGVSYALPIVVAGLTAAKGGLMIVENPEAHLHPAGQSRMGVFLAWLASKGVQVMVETHSDHVLNGMRRAIGQHAFLRPEKAVVHFFDHATPLDVKELRFTERGSVSHWPQGFFDQYQIDVAALGRLRRSGTTDGIRS
jgi:predicted ATPase